MTEKNLSEKTTSKGLVHGPKPRRRRVAPPFALEPEGYAEKPLDLKALFGDNKPLHLDIGTGKGRILIEQPLTPPHNYIGIEKKSRLIRFISDRLQRHSIQNVRLVEDYAENFVAQALPDGVLARCSILFPDPWHKQRHKKRRLIHPEFLGLLSTKMQPGAVLWFVTDHQEYFESAMEQFSLTPQFKPQNTDLPPMALTHFEIKYEAQQRPIYRAAFIKPR